MSRRRPALVALAFAVALGGCTSKGGDRAATTTVPSTTRPSPSPTEPSPREPSPSTPAVVCRLQADVLDVVEDVQSGAVTSIGGLVNDLGGVLERLRDLSRSLDRGGQPALARTLRTVADAVEQVRDALAEGNLALAIAGAAKVANALSDLTGCPVE